MLSKINTSVYIGIQGVPVVVETDITRGLPSVQIVGMASTMVMESKERIREAIINSKFEYPRARITINLTPANLRKNGSSLDLPMAIGILASSLYLNSDSIKDFGFAGELSLDGEIKAVDGILPIVIGMQEAGIKNIIVPKDNYYEASLVEGANIFPIKSLDECVEFIKSFNAEGNSKKIINTLTDKNSYEESLVSFSKKVIQEERGDDFIDVYGQENAKRAIQIAVAGRHGILMIGSPGCGKTMLARRIPSIMPSMTPREILETATIYSVMGMDKVKRSIYERPFRNPNVTIGRAGLLGGGAYPVPGEISLAHNGVLFLDEVGIFDRNIIDELRIPMEDKKIEHFRSGQPYVFPCDFHLVMAANPCVCGYAGDPERECTCTKKQIEAYRKRFTGPMMDRIDMKVYIQKVDYKSLNLEKSQNKKSSALKAEVIDAINFAKELGRDKPNAALSDAEVKKYCVLAREEKNLMGNAYKRYKLSPRSYFKVLKVARTIADFEKEEKIKCEHLAEALSYRMEMFVEE